MRQRRGAHDCRITQPCQHQCTLKCKDRNERLVSKPNTRRVLSSALHYENNMQVQRANSARKKNCPARRKFLIHNPAAITKSRTAHRHFLLSAHPSFTIFAPCAPEDVGFPRSPRAPRPSSLSALRVCCVLGSPESYRTDARRGGMMAHVKVLIDRKKSNSLKCAEFRTEDTQRIEVAPTAAHADVKYRANCLGFHGILVV